MSGSPSRWNGSRAPPPCWERWSSWRRQGSGRPFYDKLTPYVLGMEQVPGLKNMKKRLTGEHKDAVKTRADEAAKLFEKSRRSDQL